MSINFYDKSHLKSPFTYYINSENNKTEQVKKSLPLWQKITAIAVLILFSFTPLFIVGGYFAFICVTAAFKNKNISNRDKSPASNSSDLSNPSKSVDPLEPPLKLPTKLSTHSSGSIEKISLIAEPKINLPIILQENIIEQKSVKLSTPPEKIDRQDAIDQIAQPSPKINEVFTVENEDIFTPSLESSTSSSDSIDWDAILNSINKRSPGYENQDIIELPILPKNSEIPETGPIDRDVDENEPFLGEKISVSEACQYMDLINEDFALDEISLVLRSDGLYQYVKFKGYAPPNNGLFDNGDGIIMNKPLEAFQKLESKRKPSSGVAAGITTESFSDEDEISFSSDSLRTVQMKSNLSFSPNYNPAYNTFEFNEKSFFVVSSKTKNFFSYPTASCGSSDKREVALLDPNNSPLLTQHFQALSKQLLGKEQDEIFIVNTVLAYVRNAIFPTHSLPDLESQVAAFIDEKRHNTSAAHTCILNSRIPVISIDEFIGKRIGVCRHHALVTAYLLDGLTKCISTSTQKPFLSGNVKFIRGNVPGGAHAWVNFVSKNRKMHIDTLWNITADFSTAEGKSRLQEKYGKERY